MILYKYLPPDRIDVLKNKRIRFTQPGDFNDPFEFRPQIQGVSSEAHMQAYLEANFDRLIDENLDKYGALVQSLPREEIKKLLLKQKPLIPVLFRLLEPELIPQASSKINDFLNSSVGILCLSKVRDSVLMWSHYTDSHRGFVIGFDSEHPFFSKKRTSADEFGFLSQIDYKPERPQVTLTNTSSAEWFHTKSEQWSYEKEWRILRVLSEAEHCIDRSPFPICLFEFAPNSIREIIVGMRATPLFTEELRSVARSFPNATVLAARESSGYGMVVNAIN